MCGGHEALVSYREGEVVKVVDTKGDSPRIAKVTELHKELGVGVLWLDGSRTWYHYDLWCPFEFDRGFSMILADEKLWQPIESSVVVLDEPDSKPNVRRNVLGSSFGMSSSTRLCLPCPTKQPAAGSRDLGGNHWEPRAFLPIDWATAPEEVD